MNLIYGNVEELDVVLVEKLRKEFLVITLKPDKDGKYRYSTCNVNINSKEIDKDEVEAYVGMEEDFDPEEFAAACVEYYGERFWGGGYTYLTKQEAQEKVSRLLSEPEPEKN